MPKTQDKDKTQQQPQMAHEPEDHNGDRYQSFPLRGHGRKQNWSDWFRYSEED